jgi:NTP pyrophosphatase (non-canonical NTP hydrolase)
MKIQQERAEVEKGTKDMFTSKCSFILLHGSMGAVTEAAEIMDLLKKHSVYGRELDMDKLKDELGDLLFYLTMCAIECGSDYNELITKNMAKLTARYPNGYTHEAANNRNEGLEKQAQIGIDGSVMKTIDEFEPHENN